MGITSIWNWVMVAAIALIVVSGPRRLPVLLRGLAGMVRGFRQGMREGPSRSSQSPATSAVHQTQPAQRRGGWLRFLLGSPARRRLTAIVVMVLLTAYVAFSLADGLFSSSSFKFKAGAFLVLLVAGCAVWGTIWSLRSRGRTGTDRGRGA